MTRQAKAQGLYDNCNASEQLFDNRFIGYNVDNDIFQTNIVTEFLNKMNLCLGFCECRLSC